jgi:hypothetical protein
MTFRIVPTLLILFAIYSCQKTENRQEAIPFDNSEKKLNQKMLYQSIMKEKDFSLTSNGPCDDALEDILT